MVFTNFTPSHSPTVILPDSEHYTRPIVWSSRHLYSLNACVLPKKHLHCPTSHALHLLKKHKFSRMSPTLCTHSHGRESARRQNFLYFHLIFFQQERVYSSSIFLSFPLLFQTVFLQDIAIFFFLDINNIPL